MKRQSRRRAALGTLVGTGATAAITIAQAFLLIPLSLTHLGTYLYGAWLGAFELLIWVQLLDMGIPNLLTQRIGAALGHNDADVAARWSATGLSLLVAIAAGLAGVAIIAAPLVTTWARVPAAESEVFTTCFRIGAVASAMLLCANGVVGVSRGVQITGLVNGSQVAGACIGLGMAAGLLLAGFGIWALPLGLLARALVSLAGSAWFLVHAGKHGRVRLGRPSMRLLREIFGLMPSMAGASAGYLLANNSEILFVTTIFGPVQAAAYALTRRAMDGLRNLLDSIAWAVYGGFAHLVTADDRHRARAVLHEILWLRLAAACLCGAVAVSVNQAFVTLLFGAENFGGVWLTTGFAVQMILSGQAFLSNYLLRAAGRVREGSFLLAVEALARVTAVGGGLLVIGLAGAPWGAAAISACALLLTARRLARALPPSNTASQAARIGSRLAPLMVLAAGFALAVVGMPLSWSYVGVAAALVTIAGGTFLWLMLPGTGEGSLLRWNRT